MWLKTSGLRQSIHSCKQINASITNSEISNLNPLNAYVPVEHGHTGYSTGTNKVIGTGRFNTVVCPTSRWQPDRQTPGILLTTSYIAWYIFNVTWFNAWYYFESENKIWWQWKSKQFCNENNFNFLWCKLKLYLTVLKPPFGYMY